MALTQQGHEVKVHDGKLKSHEYIDIDLGEIDSVHFTRAERADNHGALVVNLKDGEVLLFKVLEADGIQLRAELLQKGDSAVLADPTPGDPLDDEDL